MLGDGGPGRVRDAVLIGRRGGSPGTRGLAQPLGRAQAEPPERSALRDEGTRGAVPRRLLEAHAALPRPVLWHSGFRGPSAARDRLAAPITLVAAGR